MDAEKMDALAAELARTVAQLRKDLEPVFNSLAEAFSSIAAILNENMKQISAAWQQNPTWEFVLAYAWACEARPRWVRRLNRTKKARTRKKYQDRILRDYRNRDDKNGGLTWPGN